MLDQLAQLGLCGMARAFAELEASGEGATLIHADWLALLVERELTHRRDKRLAARLRHARLRHARLRHARLRHARLRHHAVFEAVDYRAPRGLDRALFHKLAGGEWIDAHDNLIRCGPTGVGKSWLACALGHKACRDNRSVLYRFSISISASPSSLPISHWRTATGAAPASCAASPALSSSSSMIGVSSRSTPAPAAISRRSLKNAAAAARPS
jgi:uncharacterized protein YjbI with pentapeptide repeats